VPTLTSQVLYVFVVPSHDRRRILHVNVTKNPSAEWTAQQIVEAFPCGEEPRFLHRDRDAIFGKLFRDKVKALGIAEVVSARKSPWQNCFVERVIGSIRRECTDHVIALNERHLLKTVGEYADYYNAARTHLSLDGNAPFPRNIEHQGDLVSEPVLGGLHHRYCRAA
jgi:putative transposase